MAKHRHKRDTNARMTRRVARVAAPAAVLLTVSAVGVGVLTNDAPTGQDLLAGADRNTAGFGASISQADSIREREVPVSRSNTRVTAKLVKLDPFSDDSAQTRKAVRRAATKMWSTAELNLWDSPYEDAAQIGVVDAITKLVATGREHEGRTEIVRDGQALWVTSEYVADKKPDPGPNLGGSCTNGTSVPSGVDPSIAKVHAATCANWPEVSTYGTFRNDGEHGQGRAVDIMISGDTGWEIANFLRENYSALGIEYIIYSQKIWSVERSGEGWRSMSDRGSVTANHYDHVHVTVY